MSLAFSIATFFILWWLVLFIVLPFGTHSQADHGEVVEGSEAGAPMAARIWRKFLITTIVTTLLFGVVYAIIAYNLIPLDSIPFFPKYKHFY